MPKIFARNIYDSAEICKLVGNYTLPKLENITSEDDFRLYGDVSLITLSRIGCKMQIFQNTVGLCFLVEF